MAPCRAHTFVENGVFDLVPRGRVVQEDDGYEENVREHNIFGIWLDKDGVPNAQQPDPWKIWKFQLVGPFLK